MLATPDLFRSYRLIYPVEDLLNEVAVQTILHGGMVYALPSGAMPGGGLCAAVLRAASVQTVSHHMEQAL